MVFVVTIGLFSANIPAYYDSLVSFSDPQLDSPSVRANLEAHLSIERYALTSWGSVSLTLVWVVVGTVIFWRRSDNWMALFASLCLITFGTFGLRRERAYPTGSGSRRVATGSAIGTPQQRGHIRIPSHLPKRTLRATLGTLGGNLVRRP